MTLYKPPVQTALSLTRYAELIGINPIQFWSGSDGGTLFPTTGCTDRWWQYPYQDPNIVSRDEIAREIRQAEIDIASQLRYAPGPSWIEDERHHYTQYHRRDLTALRGYTHARHFKSITLSQGEYIQPGKRAVTLVEAGATVVRSDPDGDGFSERVTITSATALTDACEIKVYHAGFSGDPKYEIRPAISKTISGGNAILVFDSWLFFDLDLLSAWPGPNGMSYIDATAGASYITTVDVYREYADPEEQCTLYWEGAPTGLNCTTCGNVGCASCSPVTQSACIDIKNYRINSIIIIPATYSAGAFTPTTLTAGREPDRVAVSYQSGAYELADSCRRVPEDLARAIAWIATARLSRPLCDTCLNVQAREAYLSEDLIYVTKETKNSNEHRFVTKEVMTCPFGTKRGEVEAYRMIRARQRSGKVRTAATLV